MANSSNQRLTKYIKLHWIKVTIISVAILLILSIIALTTVGLRTFFQLDSFFRKSMLAGIPLQIFFMLIVGTVSGAITTSIFVYFLWGGGLDKLKSKKVKPQSVNVRWSDVIGMENIKKEVWEVIQLINDHTNLDRVGGKIIKGVLMIGPPGCGKTYLAKAIATETKLPFLHVAGSEFQGMFVGVGANRVKSLFKEARISAEIDGGCIIFIDEIDTFARPRIESSGGGRAGQDYNATVNQLLTELDGLDTAKDNIVIIAATNVPESELDSALMRPGRFDRKVYVGLPGLKEREDLLQYYFTKISYNKEKIDFAKLARFTVGNSPADIANIVRESSLIATRKKKNQVDLSDIHDAKERIDIGIKAEYVLSLQDKKIAAYHEAGHTLATYFLVPTQDVFKASIIPRRSAGGVTWTRDKEERHIPDKEYLLGQIKSFLGGYAAEKIRFGSVSSGVGKDLKQANNLAMKMVDQWGMGTSGPGGITQEHGFPSQISERDKEDIINKCLDEVNEILRREKVILDEIANRLLKEEELDYDQIEETFKKHGKTRLTYIMEGMKKSKKDSIGWDDIIGMEGAKDEAKEIVSLIKDRANLKQMGGQIIKGLLMLGPPGCGKTYLASAIANEAGIPFIAKAGSEFVEMFVGVGASRVRQMFREAREQALAKGGCIIFIDEIDALCAKRAMDKGFGGTQEHNQTLNQFLVEMDGLKEKDAEYNIVIIGATNTDESNLDKAVLRPGRFDRKLHVSLPTFDERKQLFQFYLSKTKYNKDEIDPEMFAGITPGYSPADIANLIKEGTLLTAKMKKTILGMKELDEARERIELGLKKKLKLTPEELKATAYHEAGHCLAEYFFGKGNFPFKLSIIPRDKTLGVAWYATKGDRSAGTKEELLSTIKIFLGGYAAEKITASTTNGVSQDFKTSMWYARSMVWRWGMGRSGYIGDFLFEQNENNLLSEEMKSKLDMETQELLQDCLKSTVALLEKEKDLFEHLTSELLKKEELTQSELELIFKKYAKNTSQKPPA
ncbi:MAG: AAA family ATPase [Candidatus Omnitrophica bacterium]|nr:AAA family ATPase [Candidatus Omnitrophota bacterium]